jgi:hypothetical protein
MKKEIDFSRGVRGKYAGKKIRIVGDPKAKRSRNPALTERELLRQRIAELEALIKKYEAERERILKVLGVELAAK